MDMDAIRKNFSLKDAVAARLFWRAIQIYGETGRVTAYPEWMIQREKEIRVQHGFDD